MTDRMEWCLERGEPFMDGKSRYMLHRPGLPGERGRLTLAPDEAADIEARLVDGDEPTREDVSALLDEVYALRCMLAYEVGGLEATLDYKTFPKSRRSVTQSQVARMQIVAKGDLSAQQMLEGYPSGSLRGVQRLVGVVVRGNWRNGWRNLERSE